MLTAAVLLVFGLASSAATAAVALPSPLPADNPSVLATLTRTTNGWFGGAAYEVVISTDGSVRYRGDANVGVLDTRTKKLTPGQIEQLIAAFDEAGYFSLKDRYEGGPTDAAWTMTSFTRDGRTKKVEHYMSAAVPPALRVLEDRIDAIVDTRPWVYLSPKEERRRQEEQEKKSRAESDARRASMPALRSQLHDPKGDVRMRAAFELLTSRGYTDPAGNQLIDEAVLADIAPVIAEALVHPHADVRKKAAGQLVAFGREATLVPALTTALADPDPRIRAEALAQLSRIGLPAAAPSIPALERALKDPVLDIRKSAARTLTEMGYGRDHLMEILIDGLRSANEEDRFASAESLQWSGREGKVAIPVLRAALSDPSPRVRDAAREALRSIETAR